MRAKIVLHEYDLVSLWKVRVGQLLEYLRIIHGGVAVGNLNAPPAFQRRKHHEQIGRAVAFILIVAPSWSPGLRRNWDTRFGDELLRGFVQANQGKRRIGRALIDFQHVLHASYEGSVAIGRNDPLPL